MSDNATITQWLGPEHVLSRNVVTRHKHQSRFRSRTQTPKLDQRPRSKTSKTSKTKSPLNLSISFHIIYTVINLKMRRLLVPFWSHTCWTTWICIFPKQFSFPFFCKCRCLFQSSPKGHIATVLTNPRLKVFSFQIHTHIHTHTHTHTDTHTHTHTHTHTYMSQSGSWRWLPVSGEVTMISISW